MGVQLNKLKGEAAREVKGMQIKFRTFRRFLSAYPSKKLYEEAADFAAPLGKERLISISTAGGSVTVWYWSK